MTIKNKRLVILAITLFSFFYFASINLYADEKDPSILQWETSLKRHRVEKDHMFKNDSGSPLAGMDRLVALKDARYYLNRNSGRYYFQKKRGNQALFSVRYISGKWIYDRPAGSPVTCKYLQQEILPGNKLYYRSRIQFDRFTMLVYPLEKYLVATLFDPSRPILKAFRGLKYFPINHKYCLHARIKRIPQPKAVTMLTSRNLEKTFYRSSEISFLFNRKKYRLYGYSSKVAGDGNGKEILFIPFTDKTTGKESYYTGRYLEIPMPDPKNNRLILDFNRAFNPLCNYSPAYNCAIPPAENSLDIRIEAGEKRYPTPDHY